MQMQNELQYRLQAFGDNIWIIDGPPVRFGVMMIPTRAVIVKLSDSSLWINSPVELNNTARQQLHAIGFVKHLVAPTMLHAWRIEPSRSIFPQAQLWALAAPKRSDSDLVVNLLRDEPPQEWVSDFDQVVFKGNVFVEEVEFFHRLSDTLIMADFIQNYAPEGSGFLTRALLRFMGVWHGGVPLDIQLSFLDRKLAKTSLARILSWNFDKLIIAHGVCVERNAKGFVENAFRWLNHGDGNHFAI